MKPKKRRRLSQRQERDIMSGLPGGRTQPASGAIRGLKGDGRVFDKLRVEAKYTVNESFRLELMELFKIAGECEGNERPIFVIDFLDKATHQKRARFVVMRSHDFERLADVALVDDQ